MKNNRVISSVMLVLAALLMSAGSLRAAVDYYLQIDGIKGESVSVHKVVHCTMGKCDIGQLPPGDYTLHFVDKAGKPVASGHKGWIEINSFQWGATNNTVAPANSGTSSGSTGMAVKTQGASTTAGSITTGSTTGKRMHKPIMIRKEIDMASPVAFTVPASTSGDRPMESVTFNF